MFQKSLSKPGRNIDDLFNATKIMGSSLSIDDDELDISNLQRQILYNETQIGQDKVKSAKNVLSNLNSDVKINTYKDYVDESSIIKYLQEINYDFIVDCSDNFKTKFLVNRIAVENKIK